MIPIWYSVALGSVLALSIAGTSAQYNPHLGLNTQDQDALAEHHLTVQNVQQMFAVDRELLQLLKKVPDLDARAAELERRFDSQRLGIVAVGTTMTRRCRRLRRSSANTKSAAAITCSRKSPAMIAEISDGASAAGAIQGEGTSEGPFSPALKFWTAMDAALKAEAAEWTKYVRSWRSLDATRCGSGGSGSTLRSCSRPKPARVISKSALILNVASPMGAALVDGRLDLVGGQHCSPLSGGWLAQTALFGLTATLEYLGGP